MCDGKTTVALLGAENGIRTRGAASCAFAYYITPWPHSGLPLGGA